MAFWVEQIYRELSKTLLATDNQFIDNRTVLTRIPCVGVVSPNRRKFRPTKGVKS